MHSKGTNKFKENATSVMGQKATWSYSLQNVTNVIWYAFGSQAYNQ